MKVFISYRRKGGIELAGRIRDHLTASGVEVFYDINSMRAGRFDKQIFDNIDQSQYVVCVLSEGALDRCVNKEEDWVFNEINYAIEKGKIIIPIFMQGFEFPANLPEELKDLRSFTGINYDAVLFEMIVEKLLRMIKQQNNIKGVLCDIEIIHTCNAEIDHKIKNLPCPPEYIGKLGFVKFDNIESVPRHFFPAVKVEVVNLRDEAIVLRKSSPSINANIMLASGGFIDAIATHTVRTQDDNDDRIIKPGEKVVDVLTGNFGIMAVQPFIKGEGNIELLINNEKIVYDVKEFKEAIEYAQKTIDKNSIMDMFSKTDWLFYYKLI